MTTPLHQSRINTILSLIQGCNTMHKLHKIHAQILVNGYQNEPSVATKLLHFCTISIAGDLNYARLLFEHMRNLEISAWNSMIRGFSKSSFPLEAIFFYNRMNREECRPDSFTFSFLLKACGRAGAEQKCKEAHGSIVKTGLVSNLMVHTNLVKSYGLNGLIEAARQMFDETTQRDLVSWNTMISCYTQAGFHEEALRIYENMRCAKVGFDEYTIVSLLASCAHLGALDFGIKIHELAEKNGFFENIFVCNALIDMYAKSGSLERARWVFERISKRDVFTWNSIIVGLGVHGRGDEAISFFWRMQTAGFRPNSVTFLGLLSGCSHQGLVEQGSEFFHKMSNEYRVQPGIKHYGCMVDLYGRAGKLETALKLIEKVENSMSDPVLWRILLGACRIHKSAEMGKIAMKNLIQLKAHNAGDCVLLAGIYADVGNREDEAKMRTMIKKQGIKTTPGWSLIEVGGSVHKFLADDHSHSDSNEIYRKLKEMTERAILMGYVEEKRSSSLPDFDEELSENLGSYHSEKLAIAFGLVRTHEGATLRIVKNLRVCRDCHSVTKFISKSFNREIIVRDRVRFHHFKDGSCSCKDYWFVISGIRALILATMMDSYGACFQKMEVEIKNLKESLIHKMQESALHVSNTVKLFVKMTALDAKLGSHNGPRMADLEDGSHDRIAPLRHRAAHSWIIACMVRIDFPRFDREDPIGWIYCAKHFFEFYQTPQA